MKNSLYCERDGSTSSPPPSEHDCQSAKTAAQRPGVRVRLEAGRQHGRDRGRVGPVLDHEEVADVVPRRVGDERGAAARRERRCEPPQRHPGSGAGGSGCPSVSRLSRSHSTAVESKRKYERGGSGPHVFEEKRSSGQSRGSWSSCSCSMSQ